MLSAKESNRGSSTGKGGRGQFPSPPKFVLWWPCAPWNQHCRALHHVRASGSFLLFSYHDMTPVVLILANFIMGAYRWHQSWLTNFTMGLTELQRVLYRTWWSLATWSSSNAARIKRIMAWMRLIIIQCLLTIQLLNLLPPPLAKRMDM